MVLRWEGSQPIYNPRFIDFATHYEFSPVACRVRHPNDKPRVERSFYELTLSFFRGRSFRDRADLAVQLTHWMDTIADLRPAQTPAPSHAARALRRRAAAAASAAAPPLRHRPRAL